MSITQLIMNKYCVILLFCNLFHVQKLVVKKNIWAVLMLLKCFNVTYYDDNLNVII